MANLIRRREGEGRMTPQLTRWDPFQMMERMMRDLWDPFGRLEGALPIERGRVFVPAFDVKETPDAYVISADLPGVKESDLDISLTGNRVAISGRRHREETKENETYYAYEREHGEFNRSFTLPEGVDTDNVGAEFRDGVLHVTLPKKPEIQPKRISVKAGTGAGAGKGSVKA